MCIFFINNFVLFQLKEEASNGSSKVAHLKSEPQFMFSNYGALDLSNDDAQHPDSEQTPSPGARNPPAFSGSVSRENSQVRSEFMDCWIGLPKPSDLVFFCCHLVV